MTLTQRTLDARPEHVWEILADGWLYPLWVVGASRMRDVDAAWPKEGAAIHHSVGVWPTLLDDTTTVEECLEGHRLRLTARSRPFGEARVTICLDPSGPEQTLVTMREDVASGPGRLVPLPVRSPLIRWRNSETLRRLAFLAERRP